MRLVIVGAGEVGSNVAANLAPDHDVVVVDVDAETVEDLTYSLDVLAVEGDGTSLETLQEAGVDRADILVASTDDDETNLVTCGTAKTLGEAFTIARVRRTNYLETWERSADAFDVDFMVSTDLLTANDVVRVVGLPAAIDVDPFAGGLVQMAEFEVAADSDVAGRTVAESDRFETVTFAALVRDGTVTIPDGETVVRAGDRVVVIGRPAGIAEFSGTVAPVATHGESLDVVVVGGSEIGYHVARLLAERGRGTRLIEREPERARELAEALPDTVVLEHDATDVEFLRGEHVERADALIATTDSDEKNLLVALLARSLGVGRTIAIVEEGKFADLFEAVGVDVAINPRESTAEEIVRFAREGQIENLSLIEGRQAEVLEVEVGDGSVLTDRPIGESVADLPSAVVIGAIIRNGTFVVPRGDTVVEPGDHLVLFVGAAVLPEVVALV